MYSNNSQNIPSYSTSNSTIPMTSSFSNRSFVSPAINRSNNTQFSSSMPASYSSNQYMNGSDDRIIAGGFLGPFVLGGITGGLLAPAFYPRPYPPRPYPSRPYPGPYPYYGPYYR